MKTKAFNPYDISGVDIHKDKMEWYFRWPLNFLEWLVRIITAVVVSIGCIVAAILPFKGATMQWIGILKMYVNLFEVREQERALKKRRS